MCHLPSAIGYWLLAIGYVAPEPPAPDPTLGKITQCGPNRPQSKRRLLHPSRFSPSCFLEILDHFPACFGEYHCPAGRFGLKKSLKRGNER